MKTSYEVWESGGGCQALRRDLPNGKMFLITTEEGCDLPVKGEPAAIGFYGPDDELISIKKIVWNREDQMNGMIVKMFKDFGGEAVTVAIFPDPKRLLENETSTEVSQETNDLAAVELGSATRYPTQLARIRALQYKGWKFAPTWRWEEVEDARDLAGK